MTPIGGSPCWCGQGEFRRCFRTKRFGLVRCTSCGCFRIDPPAFEREEESARFYTDYYAKGDGNGNGGRDWDASAPLARTRDSRFWKVVDQVPDLDRPRETVADIGCGEGGLCAELKAAGWPSVFGVDVSQTRITRARKRYPAIEFFDRPFRDTEVGRTLDLAIMDNVIEHLPNPASTLESVRSCLKPDGRLVVITPNMESGHFRLLGRRWTPELSPHAHIFLFTSPALHLLLSMTGFVVEASGSFHLRPYPLTEWLREWRRGKLKEALWHTIQEAGGYYGRLVNAGPMLYGVARSASSR